MLFPLGLIGGLSAPELLLILLVVLLLFGAKRIPEIARGLGKGIREFRDATHDIKRELTVADQPPQIQPPQTTAYTPPPPQQAYATPPASVPPVGTTATDVPPPAAPPPSDVPPRA